MQSLVGWRPSPSRLEAIASRLEAIVSTEPGAIVRANDLFCKAVIPADSASAIASFRNALTDDTDDIYKSISL